MSIHTIILNPDRSLPVYRIGGSARPGQGKPLRVQRHRVCGDARDATPTGKSVAIYRGTSNSLFRYLRSSKYNPRVEDAKHRRNENG